jgi:hypothetical protein
MLCAVIDPSNGRVVNVIVADIRNDFVPDHVLVALSDDDRVDDRYDWSEKGGFRLERSNPASGEALSAQEAQAFVLDGNFDD